MIKMVIKKISSIILCTSIHTVCIVQASEQPRTCWATIARPVIAFNQLLTRILTVPQAPKTHNKTLDQALQECKTARRNLWLRYIIPHATCWATMLGYVSYKISPFLKLTNPPHPNIDKFILTFNGFSYGIGLAIFYTNAQKNAQSIWHKLAILTFSRKQLPVDLNPHLRADDLNDAVTKLEQSRQIILDDSLNKYVKDQILACESLDDEN
jgi:hypothetical protein